MWNIAFIVSFEKREVFSFIDDEYERKVIDLAKRSLRCKVPETCKVPSMSCYNK